MILRFVTHSASCDSTAGSTTEGPLLFQYGTTLFPPPLTSVQTLNLKHRKPFDVMDLL